MDNHAYEKTDTPITAIPRNLSVMPKPFAGARWAYWSLIGITAATLITQPRCPPAGGGRYFETIIFTITVCCCLWEAHARVLLQGASSDWHLVQKTLFRAVRVLLSVIGRTVLIALPFVIFMPTYQCYTPRAKVSELLLAASGYRTQINERAASGAPLSQIGSGLSLKLEGKVKGGFIGDNGTIVVMGDDPPAVLMFKPEIHDPKTGQLKWTCIGNPKNYMPVSCREPGMPVVSDLPRQPAENQQAQVGQCKDDGKTVTTSPKATPN